MSVTGPLRFIYKNKYIELDVNPQGELEVNGTIIKPRPYSWIIESPQAGDVIGPFQVDRNLTITKLTDVIRGGTSVTYAIIFDPSASGAGTELITSRTCSSASGSSTTVFSVPKIPKDNWVWIAISAVSGAVDWININIS